MVWSESGGKAWLGGLASSGLAGYRACYERGNASVKHFYPLSFCDGAIIPEVTDKLLLVRVHGDLLDFRFYFLCNLSQAGGNDFVVFVPGIDSNLMIIESSCCEN